MNNGYYKVRLEVYHLIEQKIEAGQDFDLNKFIFSLTNFYPIGERTILNRILVFQKMKKNFEIVNDEVIFKEV